MLALVVKKKKKNLYASPQLILKFTEHLHMHLRVIGVHSEANLMQRKFLPPLGTTSSARKRFLKSYVVCVYILHGKA